MEAKQFTHPFALELASEASKGNHHEVTWVAPTYMRNVEVAVIPEAPVAADFTSGGFPLLGGQVWIDPAVPTTPLRPILDVLAPGHEMRISTTRDVPFRVRITGDLPHALDTLPPGLWLVFPNRLGATGVGVFRARRVHPPTATLSHHDGTRIETQSDGTLSAPLLLHPGQTVKLADGTLIGDWCVRAESVPLHNDHIADAIVVEVDPQGTETPLDRAQGEIRVRQTRQLAQAKEVLAAQQAAQTVHRAGQAWLRS